MSLPVDSYDLKARYTPALIVSLPFLITLWTCFNPEYETLSTAVKGIISAAILYFASVIVRANGKKIEPGLWESWGGPPSTQIVQWKNSHIGDVLKQKYHQCIKDLSDLPMPNAEQEQNDPETAKTMIEDAFKRVKGTIRQHDKNGLWSIANAEYGFARNLLGSRILYLTTSILAIVISAICALISFSNLAIIGIALLIINIAAGQYFAYKRLPAYTEQVSWRYAEHAWESYFNIAETKKTG